MLLTKRDICRVLVVSILLALLAVVVCGADDGLHQNCPWGLPTGSSWHLKVLDNGYYVVGYSGILRVPIWVAYVLTSQDIVESDRKGTFREDYRIDEQARSTDDDYDEPIYDRGHLAPSVTFGRSNESMLSTYLYTNVTPQLPEFNRGVWSALERVIREIAFHSQEAYVVTGCIFDSDGDGVIDKPIAPIFMESRSGKHRVALPTHFFKVVLFWKSGTAHMIGFLLPHKKSVTVESSVVPINSIESASGLDLFSKLPNYLESKLER